MHTYEEALRDLALTDDRIVVMTAENRAAIRNLPVQLGERFIDVGIAEQTMIGAAAGLALRGRIPVVHALATFLTMRAFEFIRTDVGIAGLPVKLVGGVPGFLSDGNGPTHQALEDVSLMRGIPNMTVFAPADMEDLAESLPEVLRDPRPCYIRYPASSLAYSHEEHRVGRGHLVSAGADVMILTYGFLTREALQASSLLCEDGISTGVLNLRWLKPLDEELVTSVIESADLVVTLEDHFRTGGLYSILAELCLSRRLRPRVLPISLDERWFTPALLQDVLEFEGFSGKAVADRIRKALELEAAASTVSLDAALEA